MKTKDLLHQLSQLETSLDYFSFDTLSAKEASALKSSFNGFKEKLEQQIFNPGEKIEQPKDKRTASGNDTKFIAHVSHEIRTPLNGIIGFVNLLKDEDLTPSQVKKVNAIQSASYSLMEIINEVLEYSKLISGTDEFDEIDFNLHGLVNDIMFLCQTLILNKSVKLQYHIDPKIPNVLKGDPSKLSQILLNLIGNAIKFVEKGSISLKVTLGNTTVNKGFNLDFTVSDTGIGIAQNRLKSIFESYTQAENDTFSKYGGTGLGLSIVKEIVEKQDGKISVDSKIGVGTTFKFNIPFKKGILKNIPQKSAETINVKKGKELLSGTSILVFEDNLMNQHLITEQLTKWDCKVIVTSDGKKGLNMLLTQTIDMVLMDLKMPGMNGFEISEQIRLHKKLSDVPIIAVSADFTAQDQESCISSGINDFLLKPYTLEELLSKLLKNKSEKPLTLESRTLLQQTTIRPNLDLKVDLKSVLDDCCEELDVLEELIRLFKQNAYEFIGTVKINLENDNLVEIGLAAHKLKAGLAMMKVDYLRNLMVEMQTSCKNNDKERVEVLFEDFLISYPICEDNINSSFKNLKGY
ncbi:ATP-binding protein [Maribacter sp. CXY002]|uniref:ATP-binding protein n=1 Tax=Maribacter luteocoastalis TaxID=3407671 RepID=UPI003B685D85